MIRTLSRTLSFGAILCVAFVLLSSEANAICCGCNPEGSAETPKQTCLILSDTQMGNKDDCTTIKDDFAPSFQTCDSKPLEETQCKTIAKGGICSNEPVTKSATASTVASTEATTAKKVPSLLPTALQFNTPIPGFEAPDDMGLLFATYVVAVYKYMISIGVFVATVMFIWGAFRYLVGSGIGGTTRGKAIMKDSVIGLILLLSASLLLRTVNPELTTLKTLTIKEINTDIYKTIPTGQLTQILGMSKIPTQREMLDLVKETAKKTGIDDLPCIVYASMINESGGRFVIGHDENARVTYRVGSRISFLKEGKKYSGATFDPLPCTDISCQTEKIFNDDNAVDLQSPPDYGLDWRYSHGIGPGQSTIFPKNLPCPDKPDAGRGFRMAGKCYTVPELMMPENVATIMVDHFKSCYLTSGKDVTRTFICYGGSSLKPEDSIIVKRMADFNACKNTQ